MEVQKEQLLSPAACVQSLRVCSACPTNTHSRARIQPRSSSFVTTKTRRSGVPHCRNWPRSCSRRIWIVFSSRGALRMGEITVVLDREVAERLVKRIKHPFHVNVGSEAAFQKLLAALESALQLA